MSGGRIRVAFVQEVLADYKVHLHARLARLPGYEVVLWHGPARLGTLPADVDPQGAFPHRSAQNLHFRLGLPVVWQRIREELRRFGPHIVVLEDGVRILSNGPLIAEARRVGAKVIFYTHGENLQRGRTRGRRVAEAVEWARRRMHLRADALVLYSEPMAASYRARHARPPCFVATNTLDLDGIRRDLAALPASHRAERRAALDAPEGALLVGCAGRLLHHDPRPLMDAVVRAREAGVDCRLVVIGGGPLEVECRAHVAAQAPAHRGALHLLGRLDMTETSRVLAACDVFVQAGTVGLGIVHAFGLGLPYVARARSDHGPEVCHLRDGENGLFVRDFGPALVGVLGRLAREPAFRLALADGARRYAEEHLAPERQVRGFVEAFDFVMGGAPAAREVLG